MTSSVVFGLLVLYALILGALRIGGQVVRLLRWVWSFVRPGRVPL